MTKLEIAANSVRSALAAEDGGADRVELCAALELGGTTPSYATIELALERLSIPIHVLIRPRAGDFLYDDTEYAVMLRDIQLCGRMGCSGVVLGVLDTEGHVDMMRCQRLIREAGDMQVTFHRAFDVASDTERALEDVIQLGCQRILTSGTKADAKTGVPTIRHLVELARGRLIIMPGGGVNSKNIASIVASTNVTEVHSSAKRQRGSDMHFRHGLLRDLETGGWFTDRARVHAMATALYKSALSAEQHSMTEIHSERNYPPDP